MTFEVKIKREVVKAVKSLPKANRRKFMELKDAFAMRQFQKTGSTSSK